MASEESSATARFGLCLAFRQMREAASRKQGEVADSLKWSLSKLQRFENGESTLSANDIEALAAVYGRTDPHLIQRYREDARIARRHSGWSKARFRVHLTRATRDLLDLETEATVIRTFQTILVPGPLQTRQLAEFVLDAWGSFLPEDQREARLEARLGRRTRVFDRTDPPEYRLILDEAVFYRVLGGPQIFAEQLRALLADIESERIQLRVAPFEIPAIINIPLPFVLLTLRREDQDAVLYRESHLSDEVILRPETVHEYSDVFERVWQESFDAEASQRLLRLHMENLLSLVDRERLATPSHPRKGSAATRRRPATPRGASR